MELRSLRLRRIPAPVSVPELSLDSGDDPTPPGARPRRGLVFIGLWARSERRNLAFGSNILGSLLGGLASLLSMLIGFRSLMFLALAIYLGALYAVRKSAQTAVGGGA